MTTLCPTLSEANTAFNAKMALALAALVASGDVVITPANSDNTPDLSKILAISAFQPDRTTGAEMGGPGALAVRSGVYLVTLSAPKQSARKSILTQRRLSRTTLHNSVPRRLRWPLVRKFTVTSLTP